MKRGLLIIGLVMIIGMVIVFAGCKMHMKNKSKDKKDSLLESVEPVEHEEVEQQKQQGMRR